MIVVTFVCQNKYRQFCFSEETLSINGELPFIYSLRPESAGKFMVMFKKQELISPDPGSGSLQHPNQWRRWIIGILLCLLLIYVVICAAFALMQRSMIFVGANTQGTSGAQVQVNAPAQLIHLSLKDGTPIVGVYSPAGAAPSSWHPAAAPMAPTVLFFYGNGGCLAGCGDVIDILCNRLGCNVLVVDYPGYGMSGGSASETGCYAAADAALDWLLAKRDIDHQRIVYFGDSLGAAVAIDLASRRPAGGLVTCGAFTSMQSEAQHLYPWLPISIILVYPFDNLSKIRKITCPILLVHGEQDTFIPHSMARDLAAAAGNAQLIWIPGDHNGVMSRSSLLWDYIGTFLTSSLHSSK
jgi:uncharacterized protein